MSICDACQQEMTIATGCKASVVVIRGFGFPRQLHRHFAPGPCHDCHAIVGAYHHPGCDVERCPICEGQLISCGCLDEPELVVQEIIT